LSYHSLLDSRIPLIDAGHFHTEYPVLGYLQKQLRSQGLEAVILPREEHEYSRFCFEAPFHTNLTAKSAPRAGSPETKYLTLQPVEKFWRSEEKSVKENR